jgi:hypothetical protein
LLYFLRWKIQKAYDDFKNKFNGRKAWGVGDKPALMQAHFMALLHNLLTVFFALMESVGNPNQKVFI